MRVKEKRARASEWVASTSSREWPVQNKTVTTRTALNQLGESAGRPLHRAGHFAVHAHDADEHIDGVRVDQGLANTLICADANARAHRRGKKCGNEREMGICNFKVQGKHAATRTHKASR